MSFLDQSFLRLVRISQRPHGQQPRCSKRTKLQLPFVHSLKIPFGHKPKIPFGHTKNSILKNSQKTTDGTPTRQHQLRRKLRYQKTPSHSRLRKFEKSLNILEILNDRFKHTGDNSRLQNRIFNDALSTQPPDNSNAKKYDQINFNSGRNRFTSPKTSNYSCVGNSKGIYFNNILSSKEIWRNETNNQFKTIEQLCGNNSFQNGNTSNSFKPTSEGRFSYQCGSEGCLLQHPSTSSSSQVSEIHMERTEVRVPVPTLWPQICPTNFHKMHKTNYVSSEVSRSSRHNLYGWQGLLRKWKKQVHLL